MFTNGDCVRGRPFGSRSCSKVNAELERHGRRLWNKVQAIFLGTMKDLDLRVRKGKGMMSPKN